MKIRIIDLLRAVNWYVIKGMTVKLTTDDNNYRFDLDAMLENKFCWISILKIDTEYHYIVLDMPECRILKHEGVIK